MGRPIFSIVVPVFNEERNLPELYKRLTTVMDELCKQVKGDSLLQAIKTGADDTDDIYWAEDICYEIIMVDDGSTDLSWQIIKALHEKDKRIKGISFARNFGQHPAIMAGFKECAGAIVILMDADLQNPPEEIPKLIYKIKEGYDIVYGVRSQRKDKVWRKLGSRLVHKLMTKLLGGVEVPDTITSFRAMKKKVITRLLEIKEHQFYIAALIAWMGFKSTTVEVRHEQRLYGRSKYKPSQLVFLTVDMIIGFTYKPLKFASIAGFTISAISFLFGVHIIIRKLFFAIGVPGYASLIVAIAFFSGLQILFLGIIGEYIARIYREAKGRPYYIVNEKIT